MSRVGTPASSRHTANTSSRYDNRPVSSPRMPRAADKASSGCASPTSTASTASTTTSVPLTPASAKAVVDPNSSVNSPNLNVKVHVNLGFKCNDKNCKGGRTPCSTSKSNPNTPLRMPCHGLNRYSPNYLSPSMNDSGVWDKASSMTVAVRMRPFSERERAISGVEKVVSMNREKNKVTIAGRNEQFSFDHVFDSSDPIDGDSQAVCYDVVGKPMLEYAFQGFNVCMFAYGQTGSGKTYTLTGDDGEDTRGIIPRFIDNLFRDMDDSFDPVLSLTYVEIYNDQIFNLLDNTAMQEKIVYRVREHPALGPYIANLVPVVIERKDDLLSWLSVGNIKRQKAATACNEKSSRSHAIVTLTVSRKAGSELDSFDEGTDADSQASEGERIVVKINFVDLAGSERASVAQTTGERLKESGSINKSLLTLGKVISELAEKEDKVNSKIHISYRESTLTWLLKESLGGNSKTCMLATISPTNLDIDGTLSTLRYASKALRIVNHVRVNEDPKNRMIRALKEEIAFLKQQLRMVEVPVTATVVPESDTDSATSPFSDILDELEDPPEHSITSELVEHVEPSSDFCRAIKNVFGSDDDDETLDSYVSAGDSMHVRFRDTIDAHTITALSFNESGDEASSNTGSW